MSILSSNGLIFNDLHTYNANNDLNKEEEGLEDNLAQSNASGPYSDKENAHVTNMYIYVNPLLESETNDICLRN